jgi:ATP-dependent exoDNAse (exonuclease V) alpha subunit
MAIYHLSVKPVSRGAGRSATAAAAYRAAERIEDHTTGQVFDYTRKCGVEHSEIVLPVEAARRDINWARNRQQLWNAAEVAEKRKDARVAREYEVALPNELTKTQRLELTREFSQEIANRYGCAADFAIHKPHREGDERNFHAHILTTTRRIEATGLGAKTSIEWADTDRAKQGLGPAKEEVTAIRERWAVLSNETLQTLGHECRIDHRSLEAQGEQRAPGQHLGPAVTAIERRGERSEVGWRVREEAAERLRLAAELGRIERERRAIERAILDLSNDVAAARHDRDAGLVPQYDLESERRAGREAWLEWRANNQDQPEQERTTQVHRPNRQAPDDDLGIC